MSAPSTSASRFRRAIYRFSGNRRGSAAVQFALVAPLFFALIFAVIETSIVFFAGQVLETGTQDSARLLFTNQAQDAGMLSSDFNTDLCNRVKILFSCGGLVITVKAYSPGTVIPAADLADPITSRNFTATSSYQSPSPGDTVLVRTFYQWPLFVTQLGYNLSNLGSGNSSKKLLVATSAFRVEPSSSSH